MSENISIQENGVAKTLTVDKLNTKLAESGTCDWVPEDGFKVGTLKVWRNGTFVASDFGVYGFDKVIVVSGSRGGDAAKLQGGKHLGEIHPEAPAIKEGGKAVRLYDVHRISVNKTDSSRLHMMAEPLVTVDDLTATKKGTYTAYDYGKYGFDEVTVNIPYDAGGGGSSTKPDEIRITTPPTVTGYINGTAIDISGMVVTAYKNGEIWKNSDYPNGIVPLSELTLDEKYADISKATAKVLSPFFDVPFECAPNYYLSSASGSITGYVTNGMLTLVGYPYPPTGEIGRVLIIFASANKGERESDSGNVTREEATFYGKTAYYGLWGMNYRSQYYSVGFSPDASIIGPDDGDSFRRKVAWSLIYGTPYDAIQSIPVKWQRPIDGTLLSTAFNIRIIVGD